MFLSCSLLHLLDSDSYTAPIKILINIREIAFQSSFSISKTSLLTGQSKIDVSLLVEFVLPVTK